MTWVIIICVAAGIVYAIHKWLELDEWMLKQAEDSELYERRRK